MGWPTEKALSPAFDPYKNHKEELSIYQGFLIWGNRVLMPETLQLNVLESSHEAHSGMSRMKSLASSYFWWVKMDEDIKKRVKTCESSQKCQSMPASLSVRPWEHTSNLQMRLHIDYLGL